MMAGIAWRADTADVDRVEAHLRACDGAFVPPLSSRVNLGEYARKLVASARRLEAWSGSELVGLVALYCNDPGRRAAFISSVSVLPDAQGQGIASALVGRAVAAAGTLHFREIRLEVDDRNTPAMALYRRHGFVTARAKEHSLTLQLSLDRGSDMSQPRDYNVEIRDTADHQYAYNFDFDVMHPYMMRAFAPFFRRGSVLELGSFRSDFTRRLLEAFEDVTCVEASSEAIADARRRLGDKATFVSATFEAATLAGRYDNIVMTHVLEHLDDPVGVLSRVNREWLANDGRFFLACPNANAPSRQIAVHMGIISHNAAVTSAEAEHGHRRTYSLDTLERDAKAAGLRVAHRGGIFFKALANFQWDRLLKTDIVSRAYLDGCYELGQTYPDLCSSIFLVCERGPDE